MMCCAQVPLRGMNFHRTRPCTNEGKVIREDGQCYCWVHDPVSKAERAAKLEPKKQATRNRNSVLYIAGLRRRNKSSP